VVEVEIGVTEAGAEGGEVVARPRLNLGRLLGHELQVGDDVEPHLHLVLGPPLVELSLQLLVGVGHEAGDGEEGELLGLGDRGRAACGEDAAEAGGAARRCAEELAAAHAT